MGFIAQSTHQAKLPMIRPGARSSCGFARLPYELVTIIAQCLLEEGRSGDLASLAVLLPRDNDYTWAVQRILFSHVTVESYSRYANLTRTIQSVSTPDRCTALASMVHNISAILDTRPFRGEQRFVAKDLLNLYNQCPGLKQVTLFGTRDDRFAEHLPPNSDDHELIETLESIECLSLTCPLGYLGPSLLLGLPALREVHILGGPAVFRLAQPPSSGSQIRRIIWGSETAPTLQVIKWVCAYSTEATGGNITLLTPPISTTELEQIRDYAFSRNMVFYSSPVPQRASEVA